MAGLKPFFISGANAKIRLNGKTLAFCTDVSYSIQVITQAPKILGMYEASSVEPLGYSVSGSFVIVRYVRNAKQNVKGFPQNVAENDAGNGVGNWGTQWGSRESDLLSRNGIGNDGRAHEAFDPSKLAASTTFDIEIYQTTQSDVNARKENIGVAKIRNARITQGDFRLSKKGVAMETFNFTAIYVDGDGYVADYSGLGQHF